MSRLPRSRSLRSTVPSARWNVPTVPPPASCPNTAQAMPYSSSTTRCTRSCGIRSSYPGAGFMISAGPSGRSTRIPYRRSPVRVNVTSIRTSLRSWTMCWLGVDVGGPRKGFDSALVDDGRVVALRSRLTCDDVVALVEDARPAVVGVDSPRVCAPDGALSRECERRLARAVCGIRFTPDRAHVQASGFYAWIVYGLRL